jgi:hypothetical protein
VCQRAAAEAHNQREGALRQAEAALRAEAGLCQSLRDDMAVLVAKLRKVRAREASTASELASLRAVVSARDSQLEGRRSEDSRVQDALRAEVELLRGRVARREDEIRFIQDAARDAAVRSKAERKLLKKQLKMSQRAAPPTAAAPTSTDQLLLTLAALGHAGLRDQARPGPHCSANSVVPVQQLLDVLTSVMSSRVAGASDLESSAVQQPSRQAPHTPPPATPVSQPEETVGTAATARSPSILSDARAAAWALYTALAAEPASE